MFLCELQTFLININYVGIFYNLYCKIKFFQCFVGGKSKHTFYNLLQIINNIILYLLALKL